VKVIMSITCLHGPQSSLVAFNPTWLNNVYNYVIFLFLQLLFYNNFIVTIFLKIYKLPSLTSM